MHFARIPRVTLLAALALSLTVTAGTQYEFDDERYHELLLFEWETTRIDIVIVPPIAVAAPARLAAVQESIEAWRDGIQEMADPEIASNVEIHVSLFDSQAAEMVDDPEVLVFTEHPNLIKYSMGVPWDYLVCKSGLNTLYETLGDDPTGDLPSDPLGIEHQHDESQWIVTSEQCRDNSENVCVVLNLPTRNTQNYAYDLNAHEVGHCLGIGHVGDALDFKARTVPPGDIMAYQHDPGQVKCPSTLNMIGLRSVFADTLGIEPSPVDHRELYGMDFQFVSQDPEQYVKASCSNPSMDPGLPLGVA